MATSKAKFMDPTQADISAARADELSAIIEDLKDALLPENLVRAQHGGSPDWARKGMSFTEPGKTAFVQPSVYRNYQYQDVLQNQLRSAISEHEIAKAAAMLNSPYSPPTSRTPRTPGKSSPAAVPPVANRPPVRGLGPLIAAELAAYSSDLNSGEQEQLDKIYGKREPLQLSISNNTLWQFLLNAFYGRRP